MSRTSEQFQDFLARVRSEASAWAQDVLDDPDAVILDTETTGLDHRAEIVDVAVMDIQGTAVVDTLVRPKGNIPPDATAIHGITHEHVKTAPAWPDVHSEVGRILQKASRVVIYNAEYDTKLIRQTCRLYGLPTAGGPSVVYQCAMKYYAQFVGEWNEAYQSFRWQKLEGGGHRALSDCAATLKVLKDMATLLGSAPRDSTTQGSAPRDSTPQPRKQRPPR